MMVVASPFPLASERSSAQTQVDVAVKPVEPFVYVDADGVSTGCGIDLWNLLADELGLTTRFVVYETVGDAADAVASGEGIAAISVTAEREESIDFTHAHVSSAINRESAGAG